MYKKMALAALTSLILIVGGCQVFQGNQEAVFYGTAEMEQIDISAEAAGVIKEISAAEGMSINKDTVIAVIYSPESEIRSQQAELSRQSASNELEKINIGTREEEIAAQKAVVGQLAAQKDAAANAYNQGQNAIDQGMSLLKQAENNAASAEETYRFKKKAYQDSLALFQGGSLSKQELDTAEFNMNIAKKAYENAVAAIETAKSQLASSRTQLNILKAQMQGAAQQLEAANQKLLMLKNGAVETTKTAAELGLKQAETNYELTKLVLEKTEVKSTIPGVINSINYSVGEYVLAGSPLATLSNPNNVWVKIYVPEQLLPQIKLNQEVTLRSDFVKKVFKGKISHISSTAEYTPMNIITKEDRERLVYAVKVQIADNNDEIKAGMLLDVQLK